MHSKLFERVTGTLRSGTPLLVQTEAAECGLACLGMVAGHHGHRIDLTAMRRRFVVSLKGVTLRDLIKLGSELKLATRALRLDIGGLRQLRLPCILHWDHSHFVVLTAVKAGKVTIHDPAVGRRVLSLAEVSQHFTGVALEAWPTSEFERKYERTGISLIDMLWQTSGIGRAALQVLAVSILLEAVTIAMPIGFQIILDEVVVAADLDLLTLIALGLGLLLSMKVVAKFIRSWSTMIFGASLILQWKVSLFDQLTQLPLGFFEKRHVGDVVSRFGSLDAIQRTITTKAIAVLLDGVMSIALLVMMYLYGGWLVYIAIAVTALYVVLRLATYWHFRMLSEEAIVYQAKENSHFMESVRGIASIKALNLEQRRRAVWINYLVDRVGAQLRTERFNIVFSTAAEILFGIDRIIIIYFGVQSIFTGDMTVGMLIAFLAYKDQFTGRGNSFVDTMMEMRMLSLHGERIADIALAEGEDGNEVRPSKATVATKAGPSTMTVRGLRFRYADNDPDIFRELSFEIEAGECVGIAGPSGVGKSTLLKIMGGLIRPTDGQVMIDGVSLSAMGLAGYRDRVGCVLQEDRLFAGSIAENISGFEPGMDSARVQTCAKMAAIHDEIVRMPMGYETLSGDMGSALSGGQRQRIILARALYRNPGILLLDEATSHLDQGNEALINEVLRRLPITRVIIAHRPSSLAVADRVIELRPSREGAIINAGGVHAPPPR